jgi:protease-4
MPKEKAKITGDKIAVLYAEGQIFQGEASDRGAFAESAITDGEYVKELEKLKDNDAVKAVVFRVNSPGGSAYASEQIWHAVTELKKVKPVVVSMGDLAASGGYYISCAADVIVAEPSTLTGSIGGFALMPEGADLFKRIGMTFDGIKTNRHSDMNAAGMMVLARPYNAEEKAIIQGYVNRFCDVFYTRCADGRGKTKEEIDAIGQGRVWTGRQAKKNGLVDELGSLDDAIAIAADRAKLEDYDVVAYPAQKDAFTQLMAALQEGSIKAVLVRSLLGDEMYRQYMTAAMKKVPVDLVQALMIESVDRDN